eukprot:COSAG02_NODE_2073_length_9931_cov_12.650020_3_plen_73_part_00
MDREDPAAGAISTIPLLIFRSCRHAAGNISLLPSCLVGSFFHINTVYYIVFCIVDLLFEYDNGSGARKLRAS